MGTWTVTLSWSSAWDLDPLVCAVEAESEAAAIDRAMGLVTRAYADLAEDRDGPESLKEDLFPEVVFRGDVTAFLSQSDQTVLRESGVTDSLADALARFRVARQTLQEFIEQNPDEEPHYSLYHARDDAAVELASTIDGLLTAPIPC